MPEHQYHLSRVPIAPRIVLGSDQVPHQDVSVECFSLGKSVFLALLASFLPKDVIGWDKKLITRLEPMLLGFAEP